MTKQSLGLSSILLNSKELKSVYKESAKTTDLDSGNVTTLKTRSNSNTGKYKQVFKEKDADGKLIAKQVDRNGKTRVPKRFQ